MGRTPLVVVAVLGWPNLTASQETSGQVRGRVVSTAVGPVVEAQVAASAPTLQGVRLATSGPDGVYQLVALPPGTYTIRIRAIGHRPVVMLEVPVQLGRTTSLGEVQLEPAAIELEEITIAAPRVRLDASRTTIGSTLDAADYAALPTDRDYKSLIAILPHVNTSYLGDPVNVAGSTGLENMYFIDGVNVTAPLDASTGMSLPYNFVRAVEVKVGGYEAQYGKALGAVVNAVTYSGSNHFEGEVFGFLTNGALATSPKAQPTLKESGLESYDVGARLSGPIVRDRLWFSAAYNPRVERVEKKMPALGTFTDRQTAQLFAGKLTWQAVPQANVELSILGDPTTHHQVAPTIFGATLTPANSDPYLRLLETGGVAGSLRATVSPRPALLLEASLARSWGRQSSLPETAAGETQPLYVDYVAGTIEGGVGYLSRVTQHRTGATLRGTITAGRHTVVAGGEYEDVGLSRTFRTLAGGFILRLESSFKVDSQDGTGAFRNRLPTAYLQDAWRVSDRLTLSVGIRWSGQFLMGASGGIAQQFPDEWQPRLGFSRQLGRSGTQRVFGSYGRFYQQEPLNLSTLWYLDYYLKDKYYSTDPRQAGAAPDSVINGTTYERDWAHSIDGLKAEDFDEFTLGYERLLGADSRLTVRGIRRDLRSSFNWGYYLPGGGTIVWVLGTPGKGTFSFLPPPKRQYTALELGVDGSWRRVQYRASYVLSRTWGNYTGLYASDFYVGNPGTTLTFSTPWQAKNSTGLLPNDCTHVVKLVIAYPVRPGFVAGSFFTWQSGNPINDFGIGHEGSSEPVFLAPRGSVGRTPAIWDLNLRLAYDTPWPRGARGRVLLDLLHVGNPREVVRVDQQHFFELDSNGNQANENPNYLQPTAFQPPMTARLGVEVNF